MKTAGQRRNKRGRGKKERRHRKKEKEEQENKSTDGGKSIKDEKKRKGV
jgi:hypothetical protein